MKKLYLFLILIVVLSFSILYSLSESFENENNIILYIHICQKEGWKRSFTILMDSVKESKLYENINEIRLGIVNDENVLHLLTFQTPIIYKRVYK
jgi:hypothetical protein